MKPEQMALVRRSAEIICRRIGPDVRSMTAMASKFDVVAMAPPAGFEDHDVLVLAPIERSHASIVLHPNTDILELQTAHIPRGQQFAEVPPVHAGKENCALDAVARERSEHK